MKMPMDRRKIGWVVAAGVALFLAGFIPGYLNGRSLDRQVADAHEREQVYRARDLLGTSFLQITLKNYGVAQEDLSRFFADAQALASSTQSPQLRTTLESLLARRDEVTSKLGRGAPEGYSDVQGMYRSLVEQTRSTLVWAADSKQ